MGKKKTFYTKKSAEEAMERDRKILKEYERYAIRSLNYDEDKAKIYYKALYDYYDARDAYNKIMNRTAPIRRTKNNLKWQLKELWASIIGIIKQLGGNNDKQKRTKGAHGKEEGVR